MLTTGKAQGNDLSRLPPGSHASRAFEKRPPADHQTVADLGSTR